MKDYAVVLEYPTVELQVSDRSSAASGPVIFYSVSISGLARVYIPIFEVACCFSELTLAKIKAQQ